MSSSSAVTPRWFAASIIDCCVDVYGPSFWLLLLRLIAESGSQLFAGLALRSLLDGLAPPPGDSVAFVSLSGAS